MCVVDINSRVCCLAAPGDHEGAATWVKGVHAYRRFHSMWWSWALRKHTKTKLKRWKWSLPYFFGNHIGKKVLHMVKTDFHCLQLCISSSITLTNMRRLCHVTMFVNLGGTDKCTESHLVFSYLATLKICFCKWCTQYYISPSHSC